MKNISDVYNSLKKEYPKMDITLADDVITITIENYIIKAYEETIEFYQDNKEITHCHSDYDFDYMKEFIIDYIENRKDIKKKFIKDNIRDSILFFIVFFIIQLIIIYIKIKKS